VGITGSGFMGQTHAEAASQVDELRVVAVAGGARAPRVAETYGLNLERTPGAGRRDDIDAVIITASPCALNVGRHRMWQACSDQKPMTTSLPDCDPLAADGREWLWL
jgi:hypothetical protein